MKQYPDYHSIPRFVANSTQRETTQNNFARKLARLPPPSRPIMCTVRIPQQLPGEGGGGVRRLRKHFLLCGRRGMRPVWIVDGAGWWGCSCVSYAAARVGAARSAIGPHRTALALHPVGEKGQGSDDNPWRHSSVASSSCMPVGAAQASGPHRPPESILRLPVDGCTKKQIGALRSCALGPPSTSPPSSRQ